MSGDTILNNRYRLTKQRGSGGMSVIYEALDEALGRTVAVKILRPSLTKDPSFLARFQQEARSVAKLSHPNIVTVHDVGSDGKTHYIVMEMVYGEDLKNIVKQNGALPLDRTLKLAIQICAGIGYAHRSGLVHADVKPQNILVTSEDVVKVTDFGIAQALSDTQEERERVEVVWGSPHYFAPEQAKGEPPTAASDVYSIGIVIFEMLTGNLPYTGTNQKELALAHIRDRVPMANEVNPQVPDDLAKIIYKVMSKEPSARYRMADQLGQVLQKYQDRQKAERLVRPATPPSPTHQPVVSQAPTFTRQPVVNVPPPANNPDVTSPSSRAVQSQYAPPQQQATQQSQTRQPVNPPVQSPPNYSAPAYAAPQTSNSVDYQPTYTSSPPTRQTESEGIDFITILLGIVAFIAVAGLIPLLIVVLQVLG